MGAGLGTQVRLHEDDDMQWLRALLMEHLPLVYPGFYGPLSGGLFEVLRRDVVVIDLVAILAMGASPGIGTGGGEVHAASYRSVEIRGRWLCGAMCRAVWLPECPASTTGGHGDN